MSAYTIFRRQSIETDPRVRWHVVAEQQAKSQPAALRAFGIAHATRENGGHNTCITVGGSNNPSYTSVPDGLYMAFPTDRIDFDHYDRDGHYVETR